VTYSVQILSPQSLNSVVDIDSRVSRHSFFWPKCPGTGIMIRRCRVLSPPPLPFPGVVNGCPKPVFPPPRARGNGSSLRLSPTVDSNHPHERLAPSLQSGTKFPRLAAFFKFPPPPSFLQTAPFCRSSPGLYRNHSTVPSPCQAFPLLRTFGFSHLQFFLLCCQRGFPPNPLSSFCHEQFRFFLAPSEGESPSRG